MPWQVQVPRGRFKGRRTVWESAMFPSVESKEKAQWLVDHWNKDAQWIRDNINPNHRSDLTHYRIVEVPAKPRLTALQIQNNIRLALQKELG